MSMVFITLPYLYSSYLLFTSASDEYFVRVNKFDTLQSENLRIQSHNMKSLESRGEAFTNISQVWKQFHNLSYFDFFHG